MAPRLAEGTELIGEYEGSGFQEPRYLVRRADGQVIQVPRLLYLLAGSLDGTRDLEQVAARLSEEFGRDVAAEQVSYLLDNRLGPAGMTAADPAAVDGDAPATMRSDPLLSLRFRVAVVPERMSWVLAGIFQPLFFPPVVATALAVFVALDLTVAGRGGLGQIRSSALTMVHRPELTLLVMALVLASGAFHECGHVAACRYGGARPGRMGFGLYLVWPALYSTVTDSYRLSRAGRLRTDLGGVYFNAVFIAGVSLAYLYTGSPWLLITLLLMHMEIAQQFLPLVRFDGYYILSDLIGVPDLFSRMGPVLRSIFRRRESHPRVQELKPWVRRVVTLWVGLVIPVLGYFLLLILIIAPRVLPVVLDSLAHRGAAVTDAVLAGQLPTAALVVIQMFLLVLPWASLTLILTMMGKNWIRTGITYGGAYRDRRRSGSERSQ
ncbi:MAG TPA: hypothetical protein VGJ13_13295 [Pseudonocardiaceae bacterium]|jgi:putative peptide zinc metalloprotease protein